MDFASLGVAPGAQAGICAVMPTHQACVAFCLDGDKWGERERGGMSVVTNISMENMELEILLYIN